MTIIDYGAIVFVCGFLAWGVLGTIVIYYEHLSGRTDDMKRSCQTLAGIMISTALMAFAMGVRWHHVYSDTLQQANRIRQAEPAESMVAHHPMYRVTTPSGREILWSDKNESALRTRTGGLSVESGSAGRSDRRGGSGLVGITGLRREHPAISSEF